MSSSSSIPSPSQLASLSVAQNDANTNFSNSPIGTPVASCDVHWVSVKLIRQPDLQSRPSWWRARESPPYPLEAYRAEITSGKTSGSLNGDGLVRFDRIPAGTNSFTFSGFYKEIENCLKEQLPRG